MDNNTSAFAFDAYDEKITATIPNYHLFHKEAIHLILFINPFLEKWLDTGCGTGNFCVKASPVFQKT